MSSFTAEQVGIEIVRASLDWLDRFETAANAEWSGENTAAMKAALKEAGHQPGWPYCMTAAKAWWLAGYRAVGADPKAIAFIQKAFTPGVVQTALNLRAYVVQERPHVGALMLQRLRNTQNGHAGVVVLSGPKRFATVEANTAPGVARAAGTEREGDGVYLKPPKLLDFSPSSTGLWTMGFVNPIGSDDIATRLRR